MGITVFLNAFMRYLIKYIFLGVVALGGILLGIFLRKKKSGQK